METLRIGDAESEARRLEATLGVEPWRTIGNAVYDANYDYIYNHTEGPEWYKVLQADLGSPPFMGQTFTWDGGLTLWRVYMKKTESGRELDFVRDPGATAQLISEIVADSGIDSEITWLFFQNLFKRATESGNMEIVHPHSLPAKEKIEPSILEQVKGTALLVVGIAGLVYWFVNRRDSK